MSLTGKAGLGVERWPPRRPPHGPRRPPMVDPKNVGRKASQGKGSTAAKPQPLFVPQSRRDAWVAGFVDVMVLAILALFLQYLRLLWLPDRVPEQVVYFLILGLSVITVILFAVSLIVFVLPRILGVRGSPAKPVSAGTKP